MQKQHQPSLSFYVPFENVERKGDECIVEGYAFCNEVVPGEGGIRVKRSAMEAATPDYMRYANIREMHGRNAAGVALWAQWDEKGCKLRGKIVDPIARMKVEEGVYKGLSINVHPTVMRGKEVEVLTWTETSLVDRPKDPDAVFTMFRVDGAEAEEKSETIILEPGEPLPEDLSLLSRGVSTEMPDFPKKENVEGKPKAVCPVCGAVCRSCDPEHYRAEGLPESPESPESPDTALLTRLQAAEGEIARVTGEVASFKEALKRSEEAVLRLAAQPADRPPVFNTGVLPRDFAANQDVDGTKDLETKVAELARLLGERPTELSRQLEVASRINVLRTQIAEHAQG